MASAIQLIQQAAASVATAAAGKVRLFVDDTSRLATKDESDAVAQYLPAGSLPYDFHAHVAGAPGSSQVVGKFVATRAITLDDAASQAHAGTAATAETVFDIQVNESSVGSVTFAIAGTTATFSTTGVSLAAGDRIQIIAPGSADATLADIAFTLHGAA